MIRVISSAASDLFFPDSKKPNDPDKGITLKMGVNEYSELPDEVLLRFRVMAEDKHVIFESTEDIPADKELAAITGKPFTVLDKPAKPEETKVATPAHAHVSVPPPASQHSSVRPDQNRR